MLGRRGLQSVSLELQRTLVSVAQIRTAKGNTRGAKKKASTGEGRLEYKVANGELSTQAKTRWWREGFFTV